MAVSFQLPLEVEQNLREELGDLDQAAKEALLLESYRRGKLSKYALSHALGLDRFETEALLKQRGIFEGSPTWNDIEADQATLDQVLGPEPEHGQ